ncbi:hypothetical protein ACJX0J_040931, partial [Zea mays]
KILLKIKKMAEDDKAFKANAILKLSQIVPISAYNIYLMILDLKEMSIKNMPNETIKPKEYKYVFLFIYFISNLKLSQILFGLYNNG